MNFQTLPHCSSRASGSGIGLTSGRVFSNHTRMVRPSNKSFRQKEQGYLLATSVDRLPAYRPDNRAARFRGYSVCHFELTGSGRIWPIREAPTFSKGYRKHGD
jgi:hypothetical protein